jgi:hypothetical protein
MPKKRRRPGESFAGTTVCRRHQLMRCPFCGKKKYQALVRRGRIKRGASGRYKKVR